MPARPLPLLLLALPGALLLGLFFLLPLGAIWRDALAEPASFARALGQAGFWRALGGSVTLSAGAAGISLVVGVAVALHLARLSPRARLVASVVIALPLTFSGLIVAYGFILAYGRAGFVTQLLALLGADPASLSGILYSRLGLAFASSYYLVPRVVMLVLPVLVNFDWEQVTAAETLGATRARALADVLLPQLLPTLAAAFGLIAAVVFGAYGTALALVGTRLEILPLQLYSLIAETGSDFPAAAALSLVLTAICTCLMALGELAVARRETRDAHA